MLYPLSYERRTGPSIVYGTRRAAWQLNYGVRSSRELIAASFPDNAGELSGTRLVRPRQLTLGVARTPKCMYFSPVRSS